MVFFFFFRFFDNCFFVFRSFLGVSVSFFLAGG